MHGWENTRSFMYISDAIEATCRVIFEQPFANQIVNIGVDDEISIRDLAIQILYEAGISGDVVCMPAPKGSVKRRCGTIDKFHSLTDFEAKVMLSEGIRLTLESLK